MCSTYLDNQIHLSTFYSECGYFLFCYSFPCHQQNIAAEKNRNRKHRRKIPKPRFQMTPELQASYAQQNQLITDILNSDLQLAKDDPFAASSFTSCIQPFQNAPNMKNVAVLTASTAAEDNVLNLQCNTVRTYVPTNATTMNQ